MSNLVAFSTFSVLYRQQTPSPWSSPRSKVKPRLIRLCSLETFPSTESCHSDLLCVWLLLPAVMRFRFIRVFTCFSLSVPLDGWNSAPLYWLTKQWAAHLLVRWQTFELYCSCLWALMSNAGTNTPMWASAQVPALGSWRCIITVALCEGPWLAGLSSNS